MKMHRTCGSGSRTVAGLLGALLFGAWIGLPTALITPLIATEAAAQSRSSGGYARPRGGGGYSRTPSFGGPRVTPRTPSSSGYRRPDTSAAPYARRPPTARPSAGDQGYSRAQSGDALTRYRARQDAERRQADVPSRPPASASTPSSGGLGLPFPRGGYGGGVPGSVRATPSDWYRDRGWQPSGRAFGAGRSFGVWDGLFLAFLIDNVARPGTADFFRNHRDDPGVREWRAEAERRAAQDPELRGRLDTLDTAVSSPSDVQPDPAYLPPGIPADIAVGRPKSARTPTTGADAAGLGLGVLAPVLVIGTGGLLFLAWRRRRAAAPGTAAPGREVSMGPLSSAGAMLRHKLSGERYAPSLFRVGMTLQADPTPFILAAGVTKVPQPEGMDGNLLVNVQEVGRVEGGTEDLVRLYLPERRGMFQLHLDPEGRPDECRYFGLIDEVTPADPTEWGAWLDPAEGMIGWPEFQTKDGTVYARAWAPGETRIPPRALEETIEAVGGTRGVRSGAMLYARPTGAPAPAPETEYLLVAAVEAEGKSWVEIHAGMDVNPAALQLA